VGQTFYDNAGTTHETDLGKVASFTMVRRKRINLTGILGPNGGSADDPNAVRFFAARGATTPAPLTDYYLMASPTTGVASANVVSMSFSGTQPTANNFPNSGSPGFVQSTAMKAGGGSVPKNFIDGSGNAHLDGLIPPGSMMMWPLSSPPTGWLLCDGTVYPNASYQDLANALTTTYGGVAGTSFAVPDMRARFPLGAGSYAVAANEGQSTTTGRNNLMSHQHNHTVPAHSHPLSTSANAALGGTAIRNNGTTTLNSTAFNTVTDGTGIHAFLSINFIIKV
jgi:microcystin-dependent protein